MKMTECIGRLGMILLILLAALFGVPKVSEVQEVNDLEIKAPGQTFTVTNAADSGAGSLRQAITSANASAGLDTINFNIAESGIQFVFVGSPLPTITDPVVIDGTTQPGYSGSPLIHLEGQGTGRAFDITGGGSTIKGLSFTSFFAGATNGIVRISGTGNNVITGCNFGVRGDNTRPTTASIGVLIDASNNNRIGGSTVAERNYFAIGSEQNLVIQNGASNNRVVGNWFGTGPNGARMASTGRDAIRIVNAPNNFIGGSTGTTPGGFCTGECNVIAGAGNNGVFINGATATGNRVLGNFIGLFADGATVNPNSLGVRVDNASGNTIGGTTGAERNVITGNSGLANVQVTAAGSTGTVITGNYIGLFTNGTSTPPAATAAFDGILVNAAATNTRIGGITPGERNVISGLRNNGIEIAGSNGNTVLGNYIGTNASGMARSTTLGNGVLIAFSDNNTIGGLEGLSRGGNCTGACNVISGNGNNGSLHGIVLNTAHNNTVDGNYIGLNAAGTAPLLNGITPDGATYSGNAIVIINGSSGNSIGSLTPQLAAPVTEPEGTTQLCVQSLVDGSYIRFIRESGHYTAVNCSTGNVRDSVIDGGLPGVVSIRGTGVYFRTVAEDPFTVDAHVGVPPTRGSGIADGADFEEVEIVPDTSIISDSCVCPPKRGNHIGGRTVIGESGTNANNQRFVGNRVGRNSRGSSTLDQLFASPTRSDIRVQAGTNTLVAHNLISGLGDALGVAAGAAATALGGSFNVLLPDGKPIRQAPGASPNAPQLFAVGNQQGEDGPVVITGRLVGGPGRYRISLYELFPSAFGGIAPEYLGITFTVTIGSGQTMVNFEKIFNDSVDKYELLRSDKIGATVTKEADQSYPYGEILGNTSEFSESVDVPGVDVTGRITTPDGRGLRNAVVTLANRITGQTRTSTTSSFGFYTFSDTPRWAHLSVTASSRRFRFTARTIFVENDNLAGIDLSGQE